MLAFDRDRVRHVHDGVLTAAETIAHWTVVDHEAADASRALAAARSILEQWPARLVEIITCDVMEYHRQVAWRDGTRIGVEVRLLTEQVRWTVIDDGTADTSVLRDGQIAQLVARLDAVSLRDLVMDVIDTGDLSMLALIAASLPPLRADAPGRTDALFASLPAASVGVLAVHFGRTPDAARATLAAIDRLEDGLVQLLLGSADPVAVTALVERAVSDLPAADAGRIVVPFTRLVVQGGTSNDRVYRELLGGLVAPFLLQFTSRASDWDLAEPDAAHLLAQVLRDDGALTRVIAERDRWVADTMVHASDHDAGLAALDDLAGMLGWLDAIAHREDIDDGLADRALWEATWFVVGAAASTAISATGVTGGVNAVAERAADEVIDRVKNDMEDSGAFGAPASEHQVRADAATLHDWRRTTLAATTAIATVEVLRANGVDLPDPPPAPSSPSASCTSLGWLDDFETWSASVDRRSRRTVDHAVRTVLNHYQAAEACYELP